MGYLSLYLITIMNLILNVKYFKCLKQHNFMRVNSSDGRINGICHNKHITTFVPILSESRNVHTD